MTHCGQYIRGAVALFMLLAVGCAENHRAPVPLPQQIVPALQVGKVSEQDLLLQFGSPTFAYDNDHILSWRLGRLRGQPAPVERGFSDFGAGNFTDWQGTLFDLIVVLDEHRLLKHYSLIAVHGG